MSKLFTVPALLLAGLLWVSSAGATTYSITSSIDGAQETPPVITLGTGTMTGTYDDVTNVLTWSGSFTGLNSNSTNAHFHGPAAVGAGPAGVLVAMTGGTNVFPLGVTSGSFSGSATLTATVEGHLLSGLVYVNIHSETSPGGEIRGQVFATALPEAGTLGLLAVGLAGLAHAGRRRRA